MFLTDDEKATLLKLRLYAAGAGVSLTEAQLGEVLEWAAEIRMRNAILDGMLAGDVLPLGCSRPGELDSMGFKLTDKGKAKGAEIARNAGVTL